jgi:hypothetical protein
LALDAYPEAYLDFKKALLMLVSTQQQQQQQHQQHKHQQTSDSKTSQLHQAPQQHEFSLEARQELAEVVLHTMLQELGKLPVLLGKLPVLWFTPGA